LDRHVTDETTFSLEFDLARPLHNGGQQPGEFMTPPPNQSLLRNRNKAVAKSFYRQLKGEGFSHEQIIELSVTLLDLVTEDLKVPHEG